MQLVGLDKVDRMAVEMVCDDAVAAWRVSWPAATH